MTEEIIALSRLYQKTKKEFHDIKTEYASLELGQLNATLCSIKGYFDSLLEIIPKDISLYIGGRLQIKLEKKFYYDTKDSKNNTMPLVLLEDRLVFQRHSVLDRKYEGLIFGYGDEITTFIQTDTLEFLITNWKKVKAQAEQNVVHELCSMANRQLDAIFSRIQFLDTLENWKA